MKKAFTKENVMPVVVLGLICLVVAALLGAVNMITAPVIEEAKNKAANEALLVVLPEGKTFDEIELTEDYPTEIKKAYKSDAGYVFEVNTRGKEAMTVMCGVDNDGKIVKVTVLSEQETPGYKEKVLPFVTGDDGKYNGKSFDSLEPELFSGATLTSNGVYNAVKASLDGYTVATGGEVAKPEYIAPVSQRTDDELLTLAGGLVADATGFTESKFDAEAYGVKYLAKVFKENSGKGYVAYVVVPLINEYYNKIETETLIYITNKGIIKDVNKLTWKPSDAGYGYVPPALELVDAFYESLKGKNISDLEALKAYDDNDDSTSHNGLLITQATQTTGRLLGALIEGVTVINDIRSKDMPRPEEEVINLAQQMAGEGTTLTNITPGNVEFLKRLYRIDNTNNYIAYVAVPLINEYYNKIETETLIYITDRGIIKDINKLTWKPSDAGYGYVPPALELVDAFYESLKGKNISDLETLKAYDDNDDSTSHNGLLITQATQTTGRLLGALIEAVKSAESLDVESDDGVNTAGSGNAPKIIGIILISIAVIAMAACIIVPKFIRRRKNG